MIATTLPVRTVTISASGTRAEIALRGAELRRLRLPGLGEVLWPARDPWPESAPVLFPVIGRRDPVYAGASGTMPLHGFAKDQDFTIVEVSASRCRLALSETDRTLAMYPFRFGMEMTFSVDEDGLEITFAVSNPGDRDLPFALGLHPGFRWPLVPGVTKDAHLIRFDDTPALPPVAIRRASSAPGVATAVPEGAVLHLREDWFADGAFAYDGVGDTAVRFGPAGGPALTLRPRGFGCLAFWSRTGADFLCIEPWSALPAAPGAATGSRMLAAGAAATFGLSIAVAGSG